MQNVKRVNSLAALLEEIRTIKAPFDFIVFLQFGYIDRRCVQHENATLQLCRFTEAVFSANFHPPFSSSMISEHHQRRSLSTISS